MCGTSRDCRKLCLWLTPVSICLVFGAMGFCMFGSCLLGWWFSNKVENNFITWTCNVTAIYEWSGNEHNLVSYKSTPVGFPEDDYYMMPSDGYIRKESFMTKSANHTESNNFYVCNLYGYNVDTFTVEHTHAIVWDYEKMQRFFNTLVSCGFVFGFFGQLGFLCFWRFDKQGVVMHNKVKWIFYCLLFASGIFVTGVCGLMVDFYPYDTPAKFCGGVLLGISLIYPCFCLWTTCKVAKEMGLKPGDGQEMGQIHHSPGEEGPSYTIAVQDKAQTQDFSVEGEIEGAKY